MEERMPEAQ